MWGAPQVEGDSFCQPHHSAPDPTSFFASPLLSLQESGEGEPLLGAGAPGGHSLGLSTARPTPLPPAIAQDPLRQESTRQVSSEQTPDAGKSQAPLPEMMTFWKAESICIITSFQMILTWCRL